MTARASVAGQQEVDRVLAPVGTTPAVGEEEQDDDRDDDRDQHVLAAPGGQAQLHRRVSEGGRGERGGTAHRAAPSPRPAATRSR